MTPFCHNPLCRYHFDVPDSVGDRYEILEDSRKFKLSRHWYQDKRYCASCFSAISMATGQQVPA